MPSRTILSARDLIDTVKYSPTEAAVIEMFVLSICPQLALVPLDAKATTARYSGFGLLVRHLWAVRKVQDGGPSELLRALLRFALDDSARRHNPLRLLVFLVVRGPKFFRQGLAPRGIYKQLRELR
jgi:hypothetical protein